MAKPTSAGASVFGRRRYFTRERAPFKKGDRVVAGGGGSRVGIEGDGRVSLIIELPAKATVTCCIPWSSDVARVAMLPVEMQWICGVVFDGYDDYNPTMLVADRLSLLSVIEWLGGLADA